MAVHRDEYGNIDMQDFENHLKAEVRKEGYLEIVMFTPDTSVKIQNLVAPDMLDDICDISTLTDIERYTSNTIATLEENLWVLNGRFIVYQGGRVNGYISRTVSNDEGKFETSPKITAELTHPANIENFSVVLNPAVPSGYPKDITVKCYNADSTLLGEYKKDIEWEVDTGEVDDEGNPIYRKELLDSLPSVNFDINLKSEATNGKVAYIEIIFGDTRFRHRRIRVSNIMFGKTLVLDQHQVMNVDFTDKTSYVADTLPSRVFKFDVNNYEGIYNVDNPDNGYVKLNRQTRVRFRSGYNVCGYEYETTGKVKMVNEHPIINPDMDGEEIEWDNWKELRLMDVSANADESATFTCGSILDVLDNTYTKEIWAGAERNVKEVVNDILTFEGFDENIIEWSTDRILKPKYVGGSLRPQSEWEDTSYEQYTINVPLPEAPCREILQRIAFSLGATIVIKDNGHIKFANLDIMDRSTFTNNYEWNYNDFESIPAAEQLESVSSLREISLPKYYAEFDFSGKEEIAANNVVLSDFDLYANCSVVGTITTSSITTEVTYSDCLPVGARIANDSPAGTLTYVELYAKRGIINVGGVAMGEEAKIEIIGYPIKTKQIQERDVLSDSLVLDTQIMYYDVNTYNSTGTVKESEQIKRKYLKWYSKKFKYTITTRGEPLVNAGDYGVIQTQFTGKMPVYILQNHWSFDGSWSGDMEVIALD